MLMYLLSICACWENTFDNTLIEESRRALFI
jgi:hypothetical protein